METAFLNASKQTIVSHKIVKVAAVRGFFTELSDLASRLQSRGQFRVRDVNIISMSLKS